MGNYCRVEVSGNLLYIEAACNLECFFDISINDDEENYDIIAIENTNNDNETNDSYVYIECSNGDKTPVIKAFVQISADRNSAPKIPIEILSCWNKVQQSGKRFKLSSPSRRALDIIRIVKTIRSKVYECKGIQRELQVKGIS